jgi:hypothetical protein
MEELLSEKLTKFLREFDSEELEPLFQEHFKYGTADVYFENDEIVAVVRWNVSGSGYVANILDLFIKESAPSIKVMRWMGKMGKERFPKLKYIKFIRGKKFPEDKPRIHRIGSLTKE